MKIQVSLIAKSGRYLEIEIPTTREVCGRCNGNGVHDHPAFSNGISTDEFDQDPDFKESYFKGHYDVRCSECNGRNVVDLPDLEMIELNYPRVAAAYFRHQDEERAMAAESAWEMKWCV